MKRARDFPEDRVNDVLGRFIPPKLARLVAVESVLVTAVLGALHNRTRTAPSSSAFSYSESSFLRPMILVGPLLLFLEGIIVHQWAGPERPWLR
ncbi:MAG TPA: hypothetical protein VGG33_20430 [Polyangia bacterium]